MAIILRQSTAVDVLIGPFVDSGDGYTSEGALSPSVLVSKNGQALAAKNDVTTPVVDSAGCYNCELDATDTDSVGSLVLIVEGSATALPVRHEFQVVEEAVYDQLYASSAAGPAGVTLSTISQGKPPANPTLGQAVMYGYWQEIYAKVVADNDTAQQKQIFADDESTILWESNIALSSNVFTKSEAQSGA